MPLLTADTITDEEIRELRLWLAREMQTALPRGRLAQARAIGAVGLTSWEDLYEAFKAADAALGRVRNSRRAKGYKRTARARCAEILNARTMQAPDA